MSSPLVNLSRFQWQKRNAKKQGAVNSLVVKCKLYIFNSLKKTSFVDF